MWQTLAWVTGQVDAVGMDTGLWLLTCVPERGAPRGPLKRPWTLHCTVTPGLLRCPFITATIAATVLVATTATTTANYAITDTVNATPLKALLVKLPTYDRLYNPTHDT